MSKYISIALSSFIPTGYFPVHSGEENRAFGYGGYGTKKLAAILAANHILMQKLFNSDSLKISLRLIFVLIVLFILVNVFA